MPSSNHHHQCALSLPLATLICLAVALVAFSAGAWLGPSCDLNRESTCLQQLTKQQQHMIGEALRGTGVQFEPLRQVADADEPQPTQFVAAFPERQQPGVTLRSQEAQLQLLRQEVNFLRQRVLELRKAYGITHCALHGIGPRGGFCVAPELNATIGKSKEGVVGGALCDTHLCSQLAQLFANLSVADFGAGRGQYGKCLGTAVGQYTAYDGGEGVEAATDGAVRFLDLSEPTWLGRTYDWVMSLEVGEHIPKDQESAFIGNLVRHAARGIVMSWAVPGQAGHYHVNNQPNEYVIGQMMLWGLSYNGELSTTLRNASTLPWFRNTVMVFERARQSGSTASE